MVEISFSLIRKQNPDMNLDNLEEVKSVNLNDCMIDRINNLELFSHIQQLHINQNNLSRIENISFMTNLNHIDISYNLIEAEGLMSSLKEIPPSLRSIDLTGNPCAINEDCLGKLLDAYPELNIIIDIIPVQDIEKNTVEIAQKDSEEVSNSLHENLKADELLKSIVDRKCRLQSYATFNVDSVVQELNSEFEINLVNSRQRLQDRLCRRNIESVNQILQSIHVKATEMKIRANSKDDLEDVIERLSERARNKLKEVKGDRQQY